MTHEERMKALIEAGEKVVDYDWSWLGCETIKALDTIALAAEGMRLIGECRKADAESVAGGPFGGEPVTDAEGDEWERWWDAQQARHEAAYNALDALLAKWDKETE